MKTDKEFSFFDLNQNELDQEWLRQPTIYYEHATKLADARRGYEQAKAAKELAISELDREIRKSPGVYGLEKITEGAVEKTIILQGQYQEANKDVIETKHAMDVLQAAVDALDHRKKALENLVHLHLANYFSAPKAPEGDKERFKKLERDNAFSGKAKKYSHRDGKSVARS